MEFTDQMKIIEQRKILRLVCYKSAKESKPIKDVCPFEFIELKETCKNCIWFHVSDESKRIKKWLKEKEIKKNEPVIIDLEPMQLDKPPSVDYFESIEKDRGL